MKKLFTDSEWTFEWVPSGKQYTYPKHFEIECAGKTIGAIRTKSDAQLVVASRDMFNALSSILDSYLNLVESGDCGNWNAELEAEVIEARSALKKALGE